MTTREQAIRISGTSPMTHDSRSADRKAVAKGAGLAFLGRLGALIEPVSVILFAKLYGAPTLGLFLLLWGYVQLAAVGADFAMTTALQRFVPSTTDEARIHQTLKLALAVSISLSLVLAGTLTWLAPRATAFINADPGASGDLVTIVRLYAWGIPLWCFISVSTAAVRARRAFGPEVKVRIFYEQGLRLAAGILFFALGFQIYGLFVAHLVAMVVTGYLSLRLLGKHYSLRQMVGAPVDAQALGLMFHFGSPMAVSNLIKRLQSSLPLFVLNLMLPGAAGAAAVAVYAVARKVVSVLQVIRQSFEYVMAPLASASRGQADESALGNMYAFATRLICSIFLPAATAVVLVRDEIVTVIGPEFTAAGTLIAILVLGRAVEAATGPSAALVEMLGRYRLPLLNGLLGLGVSALLLIWLTPRLGAPGAAIATAVGINVTALASLLEIWRFYGHQPYDRRLIRPLAAAAGCSVMIAVVYWLTPGGDAVRFASTAVALALSLVLLLRFGFSDGDASAFGKLGRWLRD
ncbi:MAG: hypothetical protein D6763_05175 [Alphaproteobacteria bacterium]|nr:MAG: hypothetical protein D6763_05175 [Alphaproteobacteria bacterium]